MSTREKILGEILREMTVEELQLLQDKVLPLIIDTRKYLEMVNEKERGEK